MAIIRQVKNRSDTFVQRAANKPFSRLLRHTREFRVGKSINRAHFSQIGE